MKSLFDTLVTSVKKFGEDKVPRLAAALAYYTIFSIAPILILLIAIVGFIYGSEEARAQLVGQLEQSVGPEAAELIGGMVERTSESGGGVLATVISIVTILVGATGVTAQLQMALNEIWRVPKDERKGFMHTVKLRLRGLLMVLALGLVAIASFALQTALNVVIGNFEDLLPGANWLWYLVNQLVTVALLTVVVGALFRYIPDADMKWSEVWRGALLTGVLIKIGEIALGIYLGSSGVSSTFGAAGSLVVLLLFIYYSAQILLFGAEFTYVDARSRRQAAGESGEFRRREEARNQDEAREGARKGEAQPRSGGK